MIIYGHIEGVLLSHCRIFLAMYTTHSNQIRMPMLSNYIIMLFHSMYSIYSTNVSIYS